MNETLTVPESLSREEQSRGSTFYKRQVLSVFDKMQEGYLRLELPDGSTRQYGKAGHEISAHMRIVRPSFFKRCVLFGDVGFGEAFVDGEWETDSIERVISWAILNTEASPALSGSRTRATALNFLKFYNRILHLLRPNSPDVARENIADHYDLGNDFYQLWLDPTMTYSAAKYTSPDLTLEAAQRAKYDALCRSLRLQPEDHLLEVGSGWGGMALHAVKNYGCRVTTVTISQRQYEYARALFQREGVTDRVDLRLQDYREIQGRFDKVVSIEMMEALGDRYLETYFAKLDSITSSHALLALQYITVCDSRHDVLRRGVDFIQKHIFPGSLLLSIGRVNQAMNRTSHFSLYQLDDLGLDYARTLREWHVRFNAKADAVKALGFDERFMRKWRYYLQYCEAAFAMRNISVVQAVYSRANNPTLRR